MELSEAKERLTYINHAYDYGNIYSRDDLEAIDTVLKALEDSVSKEKVKEAIFDLEKIEKYENHKQEAHYAKTCMKELLEE